jgi:hypothetical protein
MEIMRLTVIGLTRQVVLGFQFGALSGEVDFGKAREDEVE